MRWILVAIAVAVAAGLLAAYLPPASTGTPAPTATTGPRSAAATGGPLQGSSGERIRYAFRLEDWLIQVTVEERHGDLNVTYIGDEPLEVENPLLPITAGLQLTLNYTDGRHVVVRQPGTRYWNTTLEIRPGTSDTIGFNAAGLEYLAVEGVLPDGTPVELSLSLYVPSCRYTTVTSPVTVTLTEEVCGCPETQTTEAPRCVVEHLGSYPEPPVREVNRFEKPDATVYTDGVVEIRIPAEARGLWIPINMTNLWSAPLMPLTFHTEYTIINASTDGVNYFKVGWRGLQFASMVTMPPIPSSCLDQLNGYGPVYSGYLLQPGETSRVLRLWIPDNFDWLQGASEVWLYVKTTVNYQPVADAYTMSVPDDPSYSYLENFLLVQLYRERSVELVFKIHLILGEG